MNNLNYNYLVLWFLPWFLLGFDTAYQRNRRQFEAQRDMNETCALLKQFRISQNPSILKLSRAFGSVESELRGSGVSSTDVSNYPFQTGS